MASPFFCCFLQGLPDAVKVPLLVFGWANTYRKLENIRVENISCKKIFIVTGGLNSQHGRRVRDLAWSLEEIVAFAANMFIKRCERPLLEKC